MGHGPEKSDSKMLNGFLNAFNSAKKTTTTNKKFMFLPTSKNCGGCFAAAANTSTRGKIRRTDLTSELKWALPSCTFVT